MIGRFSAGRRAGPRWDQLRLTGGSRRSVLALLPILLALVATPAGADDFTATLRLRAQGSVLSVTLRAPAAGMIGFSGAPADAEQRATLDLAAENLRAGDGLLRLAVQAGCRLDTTRLYTNPAAKGQGAGELGADYRFHCAHPARLDALALGLFVGFPMLERAHVFYELAHARGESVATPANPSVSLVPLR